MDGGTDRVDDFITSLSRVLQSLVLTQGNQLFKRSLVCVYMPYGMRSLLVEWGRTGKQGYYTDAPNLPQVYVHPSMQVRPRVGGGLQARQRAMQFPEPSSCFVHIFSSSTLWHHFSSKLIWFRGRVQPYSAHYIIKLF